MHGPSSASSSNSYLAAARGAAIRSASPLSPAASTTATTMSAIGAIRHYIHKMVSGVRGVKVLLLDETTKKIVSLVFGQSEIMQHEVFLVDVLSNEDRDTLMDMSCIVFVRPTRGNVELIKAELARPRYREYHLFFSNILQNDSLDRIASCDRRELVKRVIVRPLQFMDAVNV